MITKIDILAAKMKGYVFVSTIVTALLTKVCFALRPPDGVSGQSGAAVAQGGSPEQPLFLQVRSVVDNTTGAMAFLVSSTEQLSSPTKKHQKRNIRQEQSELTFFLPFLP